jgi:hypothetical protein
VSDYIRIDKKINVDIRKEMNIFDVGKRKIPTELLRRVPVYRIHLKLYDCHPVLALPLSDVKYRRRSSKTRMVISPT